MSCWGAITKLITNLTTAIPYVGITILEWIRGGYSINNATSNRFSSPHFIITFIIIFIILIQLYFLHETGSNNPITQSGYFYKIPFNIYFTLKDLLGFIIFFIIFIFINFQYRYIFGDPDNFTEINPPIIPTHVQPEWYFLYTYAILRTIQNKLGGIIALLSSVIILYTLKWIRHSIKSNAFSPLNRIAYWLFINNFILLTHIGRRVIEPPFITTSQTLDINYYLYFILAH